MDPNTINPQEVELREQDRWLPIANVARLMKNTLPTTAKVSKDAKECMQECVSEFISFITSEASDKCVKEKRKTINGEDILYSMHDLGFENYAEVLKIYLAKYREQQALKQERNETKTTKRQRKATSVSESNSHTNTNTQDEQSSMDSPLRDQYQEHKHENINSQHYMGAHEEEHNHKIEHEVPNNGMIGSNSSSSSSIGSPEPFFNQYAPNGQDQATNNGLNEHDRQVKDEEPEEQNDAPSHKDEGYGYDDFISDPNDGQIGNHQHMDDLTKLTNGDPDIDTLTARITNENSENGYF